MGVVSRKNIISVMITSQSRLLFTTMTGHGRTMVKKDFLSFTIRMADIRQIILLLLRLKIQILEFCIQIRPGFTLFSYMEK